MEYDKKPLNNLFAENTFAWAYFFSCDSSIQRGAYIAHEYVETGNQPIAHADILEGNPDILRKLSRNEQIGIKETNVLRLVFKTSFQWAQKLMHLPEDELFNIYSTRFTTDVERMKFEQKIIRRLKDQDKV